MEHGASGSKLGAGSWKLGPRARNGFRRAAETDWPAPVLPVASRPNGAALHQPRASAAPPGVGGAPRFISKHPPKHRSHPAHAEVRLRPGTPRPKRRHSRRTPKRYRAKVGACRSMAHRAWGIGHGVRSSELGAGSSGGSFGGPAKPTGQRPVLPIVTWPEAKPVDSGAYGCP